MVIIFTPLRLLWLKHRSIGSRQQIEKHAFSLSRNHPFVDGNKRAAAAAMLVFLDMNGVKTDYDVEDVFTRTMEAAVGSISRAELAERLHTASSH